MGVRARAGVKTYTQSRLDVVSRKRDDDDAQASRDGGEPRRSAIVVEEQVSPSCQRLGGRQAHEAATEGQMTHRSGPRGINSQI